MEKILVTESISRAKIGQLAKVQFGDMVKAVVDISCEIMYIGGELQADEESLLIKNGSEQKDLWGINFYPGENDDNWIEFDSMINIRPNAGNKSRNVEDPAVQDKIRVVVGKLVTAE